LSGISRIESPDQFGARYSQYYDLIYQDKDYESECKYLEGLLKKYCGSRRSRILELGCGTGNYTFRLASRGHTVTALDRSRGMLEVARAKTASRATSAKIAFVEQDINRLSLDATFDCCVAMFNTIGYVLRLSETERLFAKLRKLLRPEGVLVFDVWNGLAVAKQGLSNRTKVVEKGTTLLIRVGTASLSSGRNQCAVNYTTFVLKGERLVDRFAETHRVRYFFPKELRRSLVRCGFKVLSIHPFMRQFSRVTAEDWNLTVVARRIE
jgi:SAM-dependent methyltransferase